MGMRSRRSKVRRKNDKVAWHQHASCHHLDPVDGIQIEGTPLYVIEELSVVFAPSRLAEMDLRNVVQPLPSLPETKSISPLLVCLLNSFKMVFRGVCRCLCTDRKLNGIINAKPTVLCNFMSVASLVTLSFLNLMPTCGRLAAALYSLYISDRA